jgi:hypothetical protein
MAKPTLIDLVQDILGDADGDEVNAIGDTLEAAQCASVVRDSFRNIVDNNDLKIHNMLDQLTATGASTPSQMNRPEAIYSIDSLWYDRRAEASDSQQYEEIHWMNPRDFIVMTSARTASDSNVDEVTLDSNHVLLVINDQAPTYYTQLEGYDNFIFDAYDSDLETNLQTSKSLVYCTKKPTLSLTSTAVIDLPEHLYTALRNDARAFYFDLYKDGVTREIDRKRRRSETRTQRFRHLTKNQQERQTGPNYGRKANRRSGGGVND